MGYTPQVKVHQVLPRKFWLRHVKQKSPKQRWNFYQNKQKAAFLPVYKLYILNEHLGNCLLLSSYDYFWIAFCLEGILTFSNFSKWQQSYQRFHVWQFGVRSLKGSISQFRSRTSSGVLSTCRWNQADHGGGNSDLSRGKLHLLDCYFLEALSWCFWGPKMDVFCKLWRS